VPTRLLREGILSSERVDQLEWQAEVFYRRLMSKVDDHGLYDARLSMLRSSLYPLRVDRVREADISRWMATCQKAGLIVLYEAGGKPFLRMLDTGWDESSKPKYPLPPENICKQVLTTESKSTVVVGVVEDVGGSGSAPNGARPAPDDSPIVITLPLRDGSEFEVRQSLVAELEPLYPAVDVPQTLREMKGWLIGKPERRKTRKGSRAFITTWLKGEQEKHGG
jgi:hypothetical protein